MDEQDDAQPAQDPDPPPFLSAPDLSQALEKLAAKDSHSMSHFLESPTASPSWSPMASPGASVNVSPMSKQGAEPEEQELEETDRPNGKTCAYRLLPFGHDRQIRNKPSVGWDRSTSDPTKTSDLQCGICYDATSEESVKNPILKQPCGYATCTGSYCKDCLGKAGKTLIETSVYSCPFLKCPDCRWDVTAYCKDCLSRVPGERGSLGGIKTSVYSCPFLKCPDCRWDVTAKIVCPECREKVMSWEGLCGIETSVYSCPFLKCPDCRWDVRTSMWVPLQVGCPDQYVGAVAGGMSGPVCGCRC